MGTPENVSLNHVMTPIQRLKAIEATSLGKALTSLVQAGQIQPAYSMLAPILTTRTPFTALDRIGKTLGSIALEEVDPLLEHIAAEKTMGGWVVIGSTLGMQLSRDLAGVVDRCRRFVILSDVWYGTDSLGERVPGPALVADFQPSLDLLAPWREDANRWVRRAVGVAVHFWAKRSRGKKELKPQGEALLVFLEPMFEEREIDAIKGVGWGLKTLGKFYPDQVADWLAGQIGNRQRKPRAMMVRKATTYLSGAQYVRALGLG